VKGIKNFDYENNASTFHPSKPQPTKKVAIAHDGKVRGARHSLNWKGEKKEASVI